MIAVGTSRRLSLMMALALLPGVAIVETGDELPLPLDIERLASLPLVPPERLPPSRELAELLLSEPLPLDDGRLLGLATVGDLDLPMPAESRPLRSHRGAFGETLAMPPAPPLVPPVPGLPSRRRAPDTERLARAVNRRARRNAQRLAARGAGR